MDDRVPISSGKVPREWECGRAVARKRLLQVGCSRTMNKSGEVGMKGGPWSHQELECQVNGAGWVGNSRKQAGSGLRVSVDTV